MATPSRRWYQFSLRTMLVLITLVCVGCAGWVHRSKKWIRARHDALDRGLVVVAHYYTGETPAAPGALWLFGEKGIGSIMCWNNEDELARRLFPEAQIFSSPPMTIEDVPAIPMSQ